MMSSKNDQIWLALLLGNIMGVAPFAGAWLMTRMGPAPVPVLIVTFCSMLLMNPLLRSAERLAAADERAGRKPFFKPRRYAVFYLGGTVAFLQLLAPLFTHRH